MLFVYMGGVCDMYWQNEVGEFLGMLMEIVEWMGVVIVGFVYFNKQLNEFLMYWIVGLIGFFVSICFVLFFGIDLDD